MGTAVAGLRMSSPSRSSRMTSALSLPVRLNFFLRAGGRVTEPLLLTGNIVFMPHCSIAALRPQAELCNTNPDVVGLDEGYSRGAAVRV